MSWWFLKLAAEPIRPGSHASRSITPVSLPVFPPAKSNSKSRALRSLRLCARFIRTYKPVLDDALFRAFDTTADYRHWCEENLPNWLGYGRV
jgi:hypothetical protein